MIEQMVNSFVHHQFELGNTPDLGTILEASEQMYVNSTMPFNLKSKSIMAQNGVVTNNPSTKESPKRKNGHMRHSNSLIDFQSLYKGAYSNDDESGSTSDSELIKAQNKPAVQNRSRRSSILTNPFEPSSSNTSVTIKSKPKKKVCFADEKGQRLTKVKLMSESSDTPPFLSPKVLKDLVEKPSVAVRQWMLHFNQPASQYLLLREKVDKFMVSLENVIVEQDTDSISGTVKVKNIGFEKEVFLRVSFDNWSSHTDVHCRYLASSNSSILSNDTFTFRFVIPKNLKEFNGEQRIEFCVGFKCSSSEFWDSNDSRNYLLTSKNDCHPHQSIVLPQNSSFTTDYKSSFDQHTDLTSYRAWKHFDEELRYY